MGFPRGRRLYQNLLTRSPCYWGGDSESRSPQRFAIELRIRLVGVVLQELKEGERSTGSFYSSLSELVSELLVSAFWT